MSDTAQIERDAGFDEMLDAGPSLVESEDFGFWMTNVFPRRSGLPMAVWVGPKEGVRHDVRVKVCMIPGNVVHRDQLATVSIRPEPRLLHGRLSAGDFDLVVRWIKLNEQAILALWNGEFDGGDFTDALRKLEP